MKAKLIFQMIKSSWILLSILLLYFLNVQFISGQCNCECVQVIGFSQTRSWYGGENQTKFEGSIQDEDNWQLLWNAGGGVHEWKNPNYTGWSNSPVSPCTNNSGNPEKVLLTVSGNEGTDLQLWLNDIRATIVNIRNKYSNVNEIILQPVVGDHNECPSVRASRQHPYIQQACEQIATEQSDVVMGYDPHVRSCSDYSDNTGHITSSTQSYIGQLIAEFYNSFWSTDTVNVTGVTITNCPAGTIGIGSTYNLEEQVLPTNATNQGVTWSSSNEAIATVDENGVVTGKSTGYVTITVTTNEGGYTSQCINIEVTPVQCTVPWIEDFEDLSNGTTNDYGLTGWTSDRGGTFSVNNGKFSCAGPGGEGIWTSEQIEIHCATVEVSVDLQSVGGFESDDYMKVYYKLDGGPEILIAERYDNFNGDEIETVSTSNLTGSVLEIVIRVYTTGNDEEYFFDNINVTALSPPVEPESINIINCPDLAIHLGNTINLIEEVLPTNTTDKSVTWSSSNTTVAAIDENGLITTYSTGSTTITVTTNEGGLTDNCIINVVEAPSEIPWLEDFTGLSNGTISDNGPTAWFISGEGTFEVQDGKMIRTAGGNESVWTSEELDISGDGIINVSADIQSSRNLEAADHIAVYYKLNGGGETLIAQRIDNFNGDNPETVTSSDLSGSTIQVVVRVLTSATDEDYFFDNVSVVSQAPPVPVTGVTLSGCPGSTMEPGETISLIANIEPSDATNKNISWSTNNTSVATVTDGVVTAQGDGSAIITVTTVDGGFTATCHITVETPIIPVTGVNISGCPGTMNVGSSATLTAAISPSNATDQTVSWSSNNSSIASVNSSGVVTANAEGSATITVTTNDGGFTDVCLITVVVPTTSAVWLEAECGDIGSSWNVLSDGNASNGEYVQIQNGNNSTGSAPTTVNDRISYNFSINTSDNYIIWMRTITPNGGDDSFWVRMDGGSWIQYNNIAPQSSSWKWDDVHNSQSGNSTVQFNLNSGNHILDVAYREDGTQLDKIYITNEGDTPSGIGNIANNCYSEPVTGVSIASCPEDIFIGNQVGLTANVLPTNADNQSVTWSSSNTSVATVNSSGLVTGIAEGSSTITVTTVEGGFSASCLINVIPIPVESVLISNCPGNALQIGESVDLEDDIMPANATNQNVSWTSSNDAVASVNAATGLVTANDLGIANITVTTQDGNKTYTCEITVADIAVSSVSIDNCPGSALDIGETVNLDASVIPTDATNQDIKWSSDNESVASVNTTTGLVTAVAEGHANIIVTTDDGGHTSSCTITILSSGNCIDGGFLTNNSFEDGLTGWSALSCNNSVESSIVACGTQAAKATNRNSKNDGIYQYVTDQVNTNGSGDYYVEAKVRTVSGTATARIDVAYNDGNTHWSTKATSSINSTNWTNVSGMVNISYSGSLSWARLQIRTNEDTYNDLIIDECSMSKAGAEINDHLLSKNIIKISPVPCSNCMLTLNDKWIGANIKVIDLFGKVLYQGTYEMFNQSVDLSNYSGLAVLVAEKEGKVLMNKIVIR